MWLSPFPCPQPLRCVVYSVSGPLPITLWLGRTVVLALVPTDHAATLSFRDLNQPTAHFKTQKLLQAGLLEHPGWEHRSKGWGNWLCWCLMHRAAPKAIPPVWPGSRSCGARGRQGLLLPSRCALNCPSRALHSKMQHRPPDVSPTPTKSQVKVSLGHTNQAAGRCAGAGCFSIKEHNFRAKISFC